MITIAGALFLFAAAFCYFRSAQSLFSLLIFSSLFPATAIIDAGSRWIPPYYLIACFFIAKSFAYKQSDGLASGFHGKSMLILFGCIGVASAIILPMVFAGTPVYSPQVGIDDGAFYRPPLSLSLGNIGQAAYLLIHILVLLAAARLRPLFSPKSARGYWYSCYFLMAIVALEQLCETSGLRFPYSLILNTPTAIQELGFWGGRMPGTFSEPAGAGLVLAGCILGLFSQPFSSAFHVIALLCALLACGLAGSTTSLVAVAAGVLLLFLSRPIFRFPWYIHIGRAKNLAVMLAILGLTAVAVLVSPVGAKLSEQTFSKQESLSYINRTAADSYAVELTRQTYGIGVGLGSNRPSSLVVSLLSNVGVIGTVTFFVLCVRLLSNATGEYAWIRWAACAVVIDMLISGPDITSPTLWSLFAMCIWFGSKTYPNSTNELNRASVS